MRNSTVLKDLAVLGPMTSALPRAARTHRSFTLGAIIIEMIIAVDAVAQRALTRYRQRRQAKAIYEALSQLDDRSLHDLGFDRSEIRSVAAEATGNAERTRVVAVATSHSLPR